MKKPSKKTQALLAAARRRRPKKVLAWRTVPNPIVNTFDTMQLLLKAVPELYRRDPSGPGVSLAWLPDEGVYYGSICRYNKEYGQGKQVLLFVKEATLEAVVERLATELVEVTENTKKLALKVRRITKR